MRAVFRALPFAAVALVAAFGAVVDVLEMDAAQYASMARDMAFGGDWLQPLYRGEPYLDKPPLLFWLSALAFELLGVHVWSYKLPSIVFAFLGVLATHRFALLHHGREVARTAALMFAGSAGFLLMTNDVRCDTILTGSVMLAVWWGSAWLERGRTVHLLACALAVAAGMLAKGPIGLVAPGAALGAEVFFKRRWHRLRDPHLVVAAGLVALALLPMCIGLYRQHGAHGLRFFFWEQSFGRITGENVWKDDSTVLFFTHELPWQVLPWTLFVLLGLWRSARVLVQRRALAEHASLAGSVLVFLALSLSQYKLPHYLYVTLPLFAVQGALGWHAGFGRGMRALQWSVVAAMLLLTAVLAGWCFAEGSWPWLVLLVLLPAGVLWHTWRMGTAPRLLAVTFATWVAVGLVLNAHVYPHILRYQANSVAGRWAVEHGLGPGSFYGMQVSGPALDFHAGHPVPWLSHAGEARAAIAQGTVVYTDRPRYDELLREGLLPKEVITLHNYRVQSLTPAFLDPRTRSAVLEERFLLRY